jgi:hypothetical protein
MATVPISSTRNCQRCIATQGTLAKTFPSGKRRYDVPRRGGRVVEGGHYFQSNGDESNVIEHIHHSGLGCFHTTYDETLARIPKKRNERLFTEIMCTAYKYRWTARFRFRSIHRLVQRRTFGSLKTTVRHSSCKETRRMWGIRSLER